MVTLYSKELATYITPVSDGNWRLGIFEALKEVSLKMALSSYAEEDTKESPMELPENIANLPEDQKKRIMAVMSKNETKKKGSVLLKTSDGVLYNFLGFMSPDGKKDEVLRLRLSKMVAKEKGVTDLNIPLKPVKGSGFKLFFAIKDSYLFHAKRGTVGVKDSAFECEALYQRWPADNTSYGTPVRMKSWLDKQSCFGCSFAPHNNTDKTDRTGLCQVSRVLPTFVGCNYNGQDCWIGPVTFELGGQLDTFLIKSTFLKTTPHFDYIFTIGNIKMTKDKSKNKRVLDDLSDRSQKPLSEEYKDVPSMSMIILGTYRELYERLLKPIKEEEPVKKEDLPEDLKDIHS